MTPIDRRALLTGTLAAAVAPVAPAVANGTAGGGTSAAFECGYQARVHLTNIIGFSSLMSDERIPRERRDEYAGHILDGASALLACLDAFMVELEKVSQA